MTFRRARASVLLLWLVACGGGGSTPDPCALPVNGAGFLAYADDRSGNFELRAVKTDGTCDQLLGSGPDYDLAPSWSAASGLVAWASWRDAARIVVKDVRSGVSRTLDTGTGAATAPAISPDGALVAFERLAEGEASGDVYVVAAAGGAPVAVAAGQIQDPGGGTCPANDAGPAFSVTAQGRFVYFVSDRASLGCSADQRLHEVWRVAVGSDGAPAGVPEQLTTGSAIVGRPTVAPDGRSFAYARAVGLTPAAVVIHELSAGPVTAQDRVVSAQSDTEPAFSASGDLLAAKTGRYGGATGDIVLLDVATGAVTRRLTSGTAFVGAPAFPRSSPCRSTGAPPPSGGGWPDDRMVGCFLTPPAP
jgi:Tol biopolymer transport system component